MKITITEIKPVPPPKEYTLTLTEDEIRALDYFAGWSPTSGAGSAARFLDMLRKNNVPSWCQKEPCVPIDWDSCFK